MPKREFWLIRFWRFVGFARGVVACWIWFGGSKQKSGHATFQKEHGKPEGVHRIAWELANGCKVPDGFVVMHTCDVGDCVNPAHLVLGTYQDNSDDMMRKGRHRVASGETHYKAKLSNEAIAEIRELRRSGLTEIAIANRYGITQPYVHRLTTGERRAA